MNPSKKTLLPVLALFCLCLAFAGAAKRLFAPKDLRPFFQVEVSADSPENVVLFLDSFALPSKPGNPKSGHFIFFDNIAAFSAEPQKNARTVLNRIPREANDRFKEKSLITLFADAGYETVYLNAEYAGETSKEALTQIKGPVVTLLNEVVSRPGRKFIITEPRRRGELSDITTILEKSPKSSILLAAGLKGLAKQDCPSEFLTYIAFYANEAYSSQPENLGKLSNISDFGGTPLTLQYIFDTAASLGGLHYATADGLKDLTRLSPKAVAGKSASFCKI